MTYDEHGPNLFEIANHDQRWIITTPKKEDDMKQFEYLFVGTEFEAKCAAKALGGEFRRYEGNEKQ